MCTTTYCQKTSHERRLNAQSTARGRIIAIALQSALLVIAAQPARAEFGVSISAPAPVNNNAAVDSEGDNAAAIAADGRGNWVAVWRSDEPDIAGGIGPDADILVARSSDIGETWSDPAPLNNNAAGDTGSDIDPELATDGAGNWVAVWASREPEIVGGIGTDLDILVARSGDNGMTWTDAVPLNTNAGSDTGGDSKPQIMTDGSGIWVAVWTSEEPDIAGGIGTDFDILVSRSNSNGAMWSAPVPLNTNADSDTGDDFLPRVATNGQGDWVAVWWSEEPDIAGDIGSDRDILVARSNDNGASWTAPAPLNTNADGDAGGDEFVQVTTDGPGHWVAVWSSGEPDIAGGIGADVDILVARSVDNGATWTDPAPLNTNAGDDTGVDFDPQVTTDGQGNWVAVWTALRSDIAGGLGMDFDVLVARSSDNGGTWTDPAPLNTNAGTDAGNDNEPQIATDGLGNWVAVWHSGEADIAGGIGTDVDILIARFVLPDCNLNGVVDGQDIADGTSMDGDGNGVPDECEPVPVAQPDCGAGMCGAGSALPLFVTCLMVPLFRRRLGFRRSGYLGQRSTCGILSFVACSALLGLSAKPVSAEFGVNITAPAPLNNTAGTDTEPDLSAAVATDGQGNWVAVWRSNEPDIAGGIGTDSDILVASSTDNGATWSAPAPLNNNAGGDSGTDRDPEIATDGQGNWVAIWRSNEPDIGGGIGSDNDILVARSADNGTTWTDPAPLNNNADGDAETDRDPQLATDGQGNWLAVWDSEAPDIANGIGTDFDILVARSTDNGATWTDPAPLNNNAGTDTGADGAAQASTDGHGNWLVMWDSAEPDVTGGIGTDNDILVARSVNNGETWTDPTPLNTNAAGDSGDDFDVHLTTDGRGNWVAVWTSNEPDIGDGIDIDEDILTARSGDDGETWTDPAPLNNLAGSDSDDDNTPHLTTDRNDNWVAVWRSFESDVAGGIGTDQDILVARSGDNGATWTDAAPLNINAGGDAGNDVDPQITTDNRGNWVAVWDTDEPDIAEGIGDDPDVLVVRFALPDCNLNGVGDGQDIADGISEDCDGNGVPDECESDRDGDGVIDRCEACPDDPNKLGPGECGCGVPDDADGNGFPDCINLLPGDPNNNVVNPGNTDMCGCGNGMLAMLPITLLGWTLMRMRPAVRSRRVRSAQPHFRRPVSPRHICRLTLCVGLLAFAASSARAQFGVNITAPAPVNRTAETDMFSDSKPVIATDGRGNWVAVWESRDPNIAGGIGPDRDIVVARSTDNGQTWTDVVPLNNNAATDTGTDLTPHVVTDGRGNWVAVWGTDEDDIAGGISFDRDILVSRSTNNGATWTDPVPLNNTAESDTGPDDLPHVATDRRGNWIAVWMSSEPDLAGGIGDDSDILVAHSTDNGATWTDPVPLNHYAVNDIGSDSFPRIATDGSGTWLAVWQSNEADVAGGIGNDADIVVSRSVDNGTTWTIATPLNANADDDTGSDGFPTIETDGLGNWVAVWESSEPDIEGGIGMDLDVLVARSDDATTWTPPAPLNSTAGVDSGNDGDVELATDGRGNWVAVWLSIEPNIGGAIGNDSDILVARSSDAGATWTDTARLNTNADTDSGSDARPSITQDGRGNWIVLWESDEPEIAAGIGNDNDILAARFARPDCNLNGVGDGQDIADGISEDCDNNGVPDECESDRDGDGLIDRCEACPDDPNKFGPGECGCGKPDMDEDGNGVIDCIDADLSGQGFDPLSDGADGGAPGGSGADMCGCGNGMIAMLPITLLGCATMRRRLAMRRST